MVNCFAGGGRMCLSCGHELKYHQEPLGACPTNSDVARQVMMPKPEPEPTPEISAEYGALIAEIHALVAELVEAEVRKVIAKCIREARQKLPK